MSDGVDVRRLTDDDLDQYFDVRAQAFGVPGDERTEWIAFVKSAPEIVGLGAFRAGRLLGALRMIPGGQFVLGRPVPMGGLAAVVVRPEARGVGIARTLLTEVVRVMRSDGIAVSSLHPASTRAYRSAGWELVGDAGLAWVTSRSLTAIRGEAAGPVEQLSDADFEVVRNCYSAHAPTVHGAIDRSPSFWRFHEHRTTGTGTYVYGIRREGGLAGYVVYTQSPSYPEWGYTLQVEDLVAPDRATAVALWRFIGANSMQVERVTVSLSVLPALLLLLDEQDVLLRRKNTWMHRIIDVPAAFAARGFPSGTTGAVDVRVTDPFADTTAGSWTIRVDDGAGEAIPGPEDAAVTLDIGALSALSIGGASVETLHAVGRVSGPPEAVARLGSILSAPAPVITDDF